jgi:two-component system, OmpR family, sensor kinase
VVRVISWQPASGHAFPQLRRRLGGWQPALRGTGIPYDEVAHIFDRFRTGSNIGLHGGTGLGLALVRSIAPGHGGEVLVRSAPGKGSMFGLMLPAMTAAGEGPASIHAHAGAAESSGTWLPR